MCAGDPLEIWFNPPSERVCFGAISEGLQTSMAARTRWVRTISAGLWPVLTLSTAPLVSLLPREWPHGHCSPGLAPSGRTSSTRRTTGAGAVTLVSPACTLLCCPPCAGTLCAHSDKPVVLVCRCSNQLRRSVATESCHLPHWRSHFLVSCHLPKLDTAILKLCTCVVTTNKQHFFVLASSA